MFYCICSSTHTEERHHQEQDCPRAEQDAETEGQMANRNRYSHLPVQFCHSVMFLVFSFMPCVQRPCHVYNVHAMCTTSMPCVQRPCRVYNVHAVCTTSMPCVQRPCRVYNVHAMCTTSMPCVQRPCRVYNVHAMCTTSIITN